MDRTSIVTPIITATGIEIVAQGTDDTIGLVAPAVTFAGLAAAAAVGGALGAATGVALGTAYYLGYTDGQAAAGSDKDKPKNK